MFIRHQCPHLMWDYSKEMRLGAWNYPQLSDDDWELWFMGA